MSPRALPRVLLLPLVLLLWSGAAFALTDEEVFRDFSLSVPEPGAASPSWERTGEQTTAIRAAVRRYDVRNLTFLLLV